MKKIASHFDGGLVTKAHQVLKAPIGSYSNTVKRPEILRGVYLKLLIKANWNYQEHQS